MALVHSEADGLSVPTELVERLSAATVGSRELDAALCDWLNVRAIAGPFIGKKPRLTTSWDEALSVAKRVMNGWHIMLSSCGGPIGSGEHCSWRVTAKGERDFVTLQFGRSLTTQPVSTPPLALCIAILKALAAQASDTAGGYGAKRSEPKALGTEA